MTQEPKSVKDLAKKKKNKISFKTQVSGPNFTENYTIKQLIKNYSTIGFQATNLYTATQEIHKMKDSKIFFGCTSNIISSGLRDTINYLARNKKFNVFVTTAGGIEEDLIKCFNPTYIASFHLKGKKLRDNGYNRIGNLLIPNENYVSFESWFSDYLDTLTKDYTEDNPLILTPSKFIKMLGQKINNEESILYWCYRNDINVYCPALTDGSIGDILTFYKDRKKFKLDIVEDIYNMNYEAVFEKETGVIIVGCGVVKHHILNANLFKNGANYCVLINNANEFDGSDAGANIEEAVSWGKVKKKNTGVKVFGDATIILPLIVAECFTNDLD
ncbi:Deoxyhypusine synthase [Conglomerata obtusa]